MLHVYTGSLSSATNNESDTFRLHEAAAHLRASLDSDGMLATNTTVLPARGLNPGELIQHLSTIPFLAAARLVIVEDLLVTLGSRRGVTEQWQPLLEFLPVMPETSHLLLLDAAPERDDRQALERSTMLRALRALPEVDFREFRALRLFGANGNEVAMWAVERAAVRGITIERNAAEALTELVGADLWAVASELDKLARYTDGARAITIADVRLLTPEARTASMFDLVDAAVEGRTPVALRILRKMLDEESESPAGILVLISRQLRNLVRAAELMEQRAPESVIGEATGVHHQYPRGKLIRQAGVLGRSGAEQALREAELTDHAVKTGTLTDALALELLLCRLSELAPAQQQRQRSAAPQGRR